jgi:lysophospholipase L1-like esterase
LTARGDANGFHLFAAQADSQAPLWDELATLRPDLGNEDGWVGNYCLTGDGQYVVATVAPWFAASRPSLLAHGGFAYSVDVVTRAVRPLASGLTLSYSSPGCGTGSVVALTSYGGDDDAPTLIATIDARTGHRGPLLQAPDQLTSAVPLGDGGTVAAARGAAVVELSPLGTDLVARLPGQVFDLRTDPKGDLTALAVDPGGSTAGLYRVANGTSRLGTGPLQGTALYAGRSGVTGVVGAAPDSGAITGAIRWLGTSATASHVQSASLDLDTLLTTDSDASHLTLLSPGKGATVVALPSATVSAPVATALPTPLSASPAAAPATSPPAANTTSPTCAVLRNDVHRQVLQPTTAQIDWAAQMATRGLLNTARAGDPTWALHPYTPNGDFPVSVTVPREVIEGVMAQESNWDQASWHALRGVAGNPLIANYYGESSDGNTRDYTNADCGYGLTQQTDGMHVGDTMFTANSQQAIGLDYAENVAAGIYTLQSKWLQLNSLGITSNNNDSSKLENWYFALWAYNSGIHPDDGTGASGLGWVNNPYNPMYPPNREDFRSTSYADAANPQWWPYQEKVIGWMETPMGKYAPSDPGYYPQAAHAIEQPTKTQFCNTFDYCTFSTTSPCLRPDSHCWWHWPASWGDSCASLCTAAQWTVATGTAEPPPQSNPYPPQCTLSGAPFSSALIVDEEADGNGYDQHVSINGCSSTPGWVNSGAFSTSMGGMAVIDYHQLGVGLDGHIFFTHEVAASDTPWTITGTWTPNLVNSGAYRIWVFVPSDGATATDAQYTVNDGKGNSIITVPVNQNAYSNQWIPLGLYPLYPGASLSMSNANGTSANDLAFDAVAFEPMAEDVNFSAKYVAMGDSFSSGQGDDPWTTESTQNGCARSLNSYSLQFAQNYSSGGAQPYKGSTEFVACSGATTTDLLASGHDGEMPQDKWLSTATRLVTLTIGGNDVGFAPILRSCVAGAGCDDTASPDLDAQIQAMIPRLQTVYLRVSAEAPLAKVIVLTYPQILPPAFGWGSCNPSQIGAITPPNLTWIRSKWSE